MRYARGHLHQMDGVLFCRAAACLAILARRAGLKVNVDDRFHKVRLSFYTVALKEWQGQPIHRQKFEVFADMLPMALIEQAAASS